MIWNENKLRCIDLDMCGLTMDGAKCETIRELGDSISRDEPDSP